MKDSVYWFYRQLTRRSRADLLKNLQAEGQVPISILFYHRVADCHPNDWTISRSDFAKQLDWLEENFEIVSLEEAQNRIQSPSCDHPTVSITFDDGYGENAEFAIPELVRRGLPATYFVATDFIRSGESFPHDTQTGFPIQPNTIAHLKDFAKSGIVIGAHTRSHPDLGALYEQEPLFNEIAGSVSDLQEWLGTEINYFAFPYGLPANTNQNAVDLIRDIGLKGFCTAYGAFNWPDSPGFHLRRIHADPGIERLKNWLTLDRRKVWFDECLPFSEDLPIVNRAESPEILEEAL